MYNFSIRHVWLTLAAFCFTLAISSLILTHLFQLHPCYLCVFQRFLYILIASLALIVVINKHIFSTISKMLVILCTITGIGVAGYQVWLQSKPGAEFTCSGGDPNFIEIFIIWLDKGIPILFQATGNCESKEMIILGISLAGWSLICFILSFLVASWGLAKQQ